MSTNASKCCSTAAYPTEFKLNDPPWSMLLGLYQGRKLDAAADVGYQHLLDHALMPRVVRRLEERLRAVNKDNLEQAYEALKNYLMIYTPDKFDADSFKAYVGVDWDSAFERTLAPEQRQALDEHLEAMLTQGAPPPASRGYRTGRIGRDRRARPNRPSGRPLFRSRCAARGRCPARRK